MTKSFAELQDVFQQAILTGDPAVLDEIEDGPRCSRAELFDVYGHAYGARLVEVLTGEFEALAAFLGEDAFDEAARAFIALYPSTHRNARWVGRDLPAFLARAEPYAARPVLAELAAFEVALSDAFDAADAPVLALTDLTAVPPEAWGALRFTVHPSARRLDLATNAGALWSTVRERRAATEAMILSEPDRLIVWRQDTTPRFRAMGAEEAMLFDEAGRGASFAQLCTLSATYDDPNGAAGRAAGYLAGWLQSELLSDFDGGA